MTDTTWLTQEAYDRLSHELEFLQGEGMAEVVKRIEAARAEGDLKENGGYHAAREEQGKMAGRIASLKALLNNARVGEAPTDSSTVQPGMVVTATIGGKERAFLLGSREVAGDSDLTVYSEKSPIGAALVGARVGESRSYQTPAGKEVSVTIDAVAPYAG
ncbi:MAG: transcription elongation factor GreA [Bifidobacteriaceae bacterium]|jgi:transcription elongation factor GreA|nr:transcription elongation factor GreA [Bifidobacteriaceae bacterium]